MGEIGQGGFWEQVSFKPGPKVIRLCENLGTKRSREGNGMCKGPEAEEAYLVHLKNDEAACMS